MYGSLSSNLTSSNLDLLTVKTKLIPLDTLTETKKENKDKNVITIVVTTNNFLSNSSVSGTVLNIYVTYLLIL